MLPVNLLVRLGALAAARQCARHGGRVYSLGSMSVAGRTTTAACAKAFRLAIAKVDAEIYCGRRLTAVGWLENACDVLWDARALGVDVEPWGEKFDSYARELQWPAGG